MAGDGFSKKQNLTRAQYYLKTVLSAGGYSAYLLVFGPPPAGMRGRGNDDEDVQFS